MNFKSRILKLSIIIMLVLVLIPVVAAEDSSESFFIEYADQIDEEVVVEESYSIEEVEYAQEDVSVSSEVPAVEEKYEKNFAHMESGEEIEEFNSDISISEQDCSVVEAHDIVEEKEDIPNLYCENINDVVDFNNINYEDMSELESKELTIEINQVMQVSKLKIGGAFLESLFLLDSQNMPGRIEGVESFLREEHLWQHLVGARYQFVNHLTIMAFIRWPFLIQVWHILGIHDSQIRQAVFEKQDGLVGSFLVLIPSVGQGGCFN